METLALIWLVHKITVLCSGHCVCVTVCALWHRSCQGEMFVSEQLNAVFRISLS